MEESPTGFRFYPTEEELISFYLHNQLCGLKQDKLHRVIPVLDIFDTEPWNLPQVAGELCREDREQWFFFAPMQEREARGGRPSRSMATGYWKATGSTSYVYSSENKVIGVKKSMVFYVGKAPTGRKTPWKLNEYRAIELSPSNPNSTGSNGSIPKLKREFTLCRVYVVSGSSRAFDRRPPEAVAGETAIQVSDGAASSGGRASSGGCGDGDASLSGVVAGNAGSSSQLEMASLEEPIWDWEQLDWL
ncbi:NAC domain-containing protein 90-like [Rhodamnia argentea]|uniref:NAC domain-containing protein 90-like n=1 Tax=Rhodamnia argentea TaxID=178133 RepID=A0A8B8NIB9_9MYRT|nr:NAC domain-containing protein 90-like [Rhodamnia argentea]